jgi:hypothetical protein
VEELWRVFKDGRSKERHVDVVPVASLLKPACLCGSLCMGIYRFWYELDGQLFMVDVDRIRVDWLLDEIREEASPESYSQLPTLLLDWDHDTGWCGIDEPFGSPTTSANIRDLAGILTSRDDELAGVLCDLADRADATRSEMWAMTG